MCDPKKTVTDIVNLAKSHAKAFHELNMRYTHLESLQSICTEQHIEYVDTMITHTLGELAELNDFLELVANEIIDKITEA